jgi:peptidase E
MPDVSAHLRGQDVIWVDRGSLANLLALWRVHALGKVLRDCWESGVVLGGESAGSLCWHTGGTTDSFGEVRPLTDRLGFLPYSNGCVMANGASCSSGVSLRASPDGYATDAGAGLHDEGTDLVAAIADREHAGAYRVTRRSADGGVSEEPLEVAYLTW